MSDTTLPIEIHFRRDAITSQMDNTVQLICEINAPEHLATQLQTRPPLHLAIAIDRSWSMEGEGLECAKQAALHVLDELSPKDKICILSYGDDVQIHVPLQSVSNKEQISEAIRSIQVDGLTNLFGGWQEARYQLQFQAHPTVISRVLLLSDGRITTGVFNEEEILNHCLCAKQAGVSTTTFGMGRMFTEGLMTQMASNGGGNSYYCPTPESMKYAFVQEVQQLKQIVAQNVSMTIQSNHSIQVLNPGVKLIDNGGQTLDLCIGTKTWLAFEIDVAAKRSGKGDGHNVSLGLLSVKYIDLHGEAHESLHPLMLPSFPENVASVLVDNPEVSKRLDQVMIGRLCYEANKAAKSGNWVKVTGLIERAKKMALNNEAVLYELYLLEEERDLQRVAKQAWYMGSDLSMRLERSVEVDEDDTFDQYIRNQHPSMSPDQRYKQSSTRKKSA